MQIRRSIVRKIRRDQDTRNVVSALMTECRTKTGTSARRGFIESDWRKTTTSTGRMVNRTIAEDKSSCSRQDMNLIILNTGTLPEINQLHGCEEKEAFLCLNPNVKPSDFTLLVAVVAVSAVLLAFICAVFLYRKSPRRDERTRFQEDRESIDPATTRCNQQEQICTGP